MTELLLYNFYIVFKRKDGSGKNHSSGDTGIKPGVTGMWQVSGRSDITDFEEVERLDTEYIEGWNIGLDMKVLAQTVFFVLGRKGLR